MVNKWEGTVDYWLIYTGDPDTVGIDGGFYCPKDAAFSGTVNNIDVKDMEKSHEKRLENGGENNVEKHAILGIGYQAYDKDIEGNIFGIHQSDLTAA